jgi:hypothetical protein
LGNTASELEGAAMLKESLWRQIQVHRATLMVEILKDNARPEAGAVYGAMDMPWAKLVGQIAQAYGN